MKTLILIILIPVVAAAWELPPGLELVERDSLRIAVRDIETGQVEIYYCPGEPADIPGWDISDQYNIPITASLTDTCHEFFHFANLEDQRRLKFGDADRDGLTEIAASRITNVIYEYSGHDSTFNLEFSQFIGADLDYAKDTDGDGLLEYLMSPDSGVVIYESADSFSLPINYVFTWPNEAIANKGGAYDLDGDGVWEISLRSSLRLIEVLRCIGDNAYELDYTIATPDTFDGLFYDYISADFDDDGRNELVTTSSNRWVLGYEYVQPDSFEYVWHGRVSYQNGRWLKGPVDFDMDGNIEFVVMAVSQVMGGFFFYLYECEGDNQFQQVYADSLPGNPWFYGAIEIFDIDGDGSMELIVCSDYWIGIYKSSGDDSLELVDLIQDPADLIFVFDVNSNGFAEIIQNHGPAIGLDFMEYWPGLNIHGDVNNDCEVNLQDPLYLITYFKGYTTLLPRDKYNADVNGNCIVNGVDVTYFVAYFKGGDDLIDEDCE